MLNKKNSRIIILVIIIILGVITYLLSSRNVNAPTDIIGKSEETSPKVTPKPGEVVQDFEGEADPSRMTLGMNTWNWIQTIYSNSSNVIPKTNKFTLTLKADKTFSATTDCNGVGGEYTVNGNKISFTKMMSTLMYCEGSQESDYSKMLGQVEGYHFTSKGELIFDLELDTGNMIFR